MSHYHDHGHDPETGYQILSFTCAECRREAPAEHEVVFDGRSLCESCADEASGMFQCDECEEAFGLEQRVIHRCRGLCHACALQLAPTAPITRKTGS